jgi:hypothetical protein
VKRKTLVLFFFFAFQLGVKSQDSSFFNETGKIPVSYTRIRKGGMNFRDSVCYLIERKIQRPPVGYKASDIVYIEYDIVKQKLSSPNTTNSIYKGFVDKLLQDQNLTRLVRDSSKTGFIVPVFFHVVNDETDPDLAENILLSSYAVHKLLVMLSQTGKNNKEIWECVQILSYSTNRKVE